MLLMITNKNFWGGWLKDGVISDPWPMFYGPTFPPLAENA